MHGYSHRPLHVDTEGEEGAESLSAMRKLCDHCKAPLYLLELDSGAKVYVDALPHHVKHRRRGKPAPVRKDAELLVNGQAPRPREGGASEEDWAKFQKLLEEQG